jgi:transposase
MERYYLGLDWGDQSHAVWVVNEAGDKVWAGQVKQRAEELGEFAHRLYGWASGGVEIWGSVEKPEGRIVDFLLDHGVVVYPVNPKSLDRARDRFRVSGSKSDPFDARVLAEFLRTDHGHLRPLVPNSPHAQELKLMTTDHERLVQQQTRLINQLKATLKEYYPLILEMFHHINTPTALDLLTRYPSPEALARMTAEDWQSFATEHRLRSRRAAELWEQAKAPQVTIPPHVVRAKARLVRVLAAELQTVRTAVEEYREEIERFFASMPASKVARSLPAGKTGVIIPMIWAEMGDAPGRWESFRHLQAEAGAVPVTKQSGKSAFVQFRFACNKRLRYAADRFAFLTMRRSGWASSYYQQQRARAHRHDHALRALAAKWLKIIFIMWSRHVPYIEDHHLATINRQTRSQQFLIQGTLTAP